MKKQAEDTWKNKLYFGDCLEIMRDFYDNNKEGFIDLIYVDPPVNSKRDYNVLFESIDLKDAMVIKYLPNPNQIVSVDIMEE